MIATDSWARRHLPWSVVTLTLLSSVACGDSGTEDDTATDTADATEEAWLAPPRTPCSSDADCVDDNACTWDERCESDGLCAARILACDDGNECTSDVCDPAQGCTFVPFEGVCDDGNPCTLGDACKDGACFPSEVKTCDDNNPCTRDSCDPDSGDCRFEPESDLANIACDDGDACTTKGRCDEGRCAYEPVLCPSDTQCKSWSCDPDEGCVATPLVGACNDGNVCTVADACDAGECKGTTRTCGDDNVCTDDRCDPKTGCFFPANEAACDDGIQCTTGDHCVEGACASGATDCDDDNACTTDICDGANGCKHFAAVGACDDGDPCTVGDHCEAGECVDGEATRCDDDKLCTQDTCTPNGQNAICSHSTSAVCLDQLVHGNYYGLFYFGFDALATDPNDFDCLGTAVATLVEDPTTTADVVTGSASCTWDLSVALDHSVLIDFSAHDDGGSVFLDLGSVTVKARPFSGTLHARGALVAEMPITVYVTTDFGNPKVLIFALGTGTAPPANQPKALGVGFDMDLSDFDVPLCCQGDGDGDCFPGGADLCASVGGTAVTPESSGECCIDLPTGVSCVDAPASWCAKTDNATYFGPSPSACCLASGCALLSETDCDSAGGSYAEALGCDDDDDDGFADVCPAPPGCAQPGLATCSLSGKILSVAPTGFQSIPLRAEGSWTPAGTNTWTTNLPFWITVGGVDVPVPVLPPGLITVSCTNGVAVTGSFDIPDLSIAGFDLAAPETETPTFTLGFGLGQDLDALDAPLSDCRTYIYFNGNSRFTIGSGQDQSVVNSGSQIVFAVDPFDPAFYVDAKGQILDGPTGGLASHVGFGISRGGHLKWVSDYAIPPAPGRPPEGVTLFGHLFATGDIDIPIAGPVKIGVDGESVYNLGPYPQAAEAILAGILRGDIGAIGGALSDLGTNLTSGQVLNQLAYGVNAREIRLSVDDFTVVLGRGSLVAANSSVRFAAEVGNLDVMFPDVFPQELATALSKFSVKQVYTATGVVDATGFEVRVIADLSFGPVNLNGAGFLIGYHGGHWTVDIDEPSISLDFIAWLESFKDFIGCDFQTNEASCSVAGVPVGKIAFDTSNGRLFISMEAILPGSMGKVMFSTTVTKNGDFIFTGHATIPLSGIQNLDATLVLTNEGVRVIGTIADISTSMTFDGTIYFDGSFLLTGLGSMTLLLFVNLDASATVSYCPANSVCAQKGNVVGDFVMLIQGEVDTPVGEATLQGELIYQGSTITYDLQGLADFDVGGFASLDGTMRVTNRGTPGAYLHMNLDVPLVTGQVDGELFSNGSFTFAGSGSLKIPGFSSLATASISVSSEQGITVASELGVAGATMQFSGRIGPDGFTFTGSNNINLLGFVVQGNVVFTGSTSGASFTFSGGLYVATTRIVVSGSVQSSGQFSFTGQSTIGLFGYTLSSAAVTFDNSGLSVAGSMNILNLAAFQMSGRIQSNLDFSLNASAQAVTFPGGLSGQLSAHISKHNSLISVGGSGYASFFGAHANGGFSVDTAGKFEFYGTVGFDWSAGNLSLEGEVRLKVKNSGFSASASAEACADFWLDSGCASVGGSINSSGEVCVNFPIAGTKCVDIL